MIVVGIKEAPFVQMDTVARALESAEICGDEIARFIPARANGAINNYRIAIRSTRK
jgi:hypothetical protein